MTRRRDCCRNGHLFVFRLLITFRGLLIIRHFFLFIYLCVFRHVIILLCTAVYDLYVYLSVNRLRTRRIRAIKVNLPKLVSRKK